VCVRERERFALKPLCGDAKTSSQVKNYCHSVKWSHLTLGALTPRCCWEKIYREKEIDKKGNHKGKKELQSNELCGFACSFVVPSLLLINEQCGVAGELLSLFACCHSDNNTRICKMWNICNQILSIRSVEHTYIHLTLLFFIYSIMTFLKRFYR